MSFRLLAAFGLAGLAVGYVATRACDAIGLPPFIALLVATFLLGGLGVALRASEFPVFLSRAYVFGYAAFLGTAIVRYGSTKQTLFLWINEGANRFAHPVEGLYAIVPVLGLAVAGMMVGAGTLAYALAQHLDAPKADQRAVEFLQFLDSRKSK